MYDDNDEVNDKIADDDDDDGNSLSLDQWFVIHAYINRTTKALNAQHDRYFYVLFC